MIRRNRFILILVLFIWVVGITPLQADIFSILRVSGTTTTTVQTAPSPQNFGYYPTLWRTFPTAQPPISTPIPSPIVPATAMPTTIIRGAAPVSTGPRAWLGMPTPMSSNR